MERKKFEIRSEPKKKFEIRPENQVGQTTEWFRQTNDSDCGPCLILNGLRKIHGARHVPASIEEVRRDVNQLRRTSGRPELQPNGWFTSEDIQEYLKQIAGLSVKEYALFQDSADEVRQNIQAELQQPFELVYGTAGRHFRAFVPTERGFELLDSFNDAPQQVASGALGEFIGRAARESTGTRVERIGVVRIPENNR